VRIISFASHSFVPAAHDNPQSPGVLKKVLLKKGDLRSSHVQMVNWASLGIGKCFAPHYHEDMQEIFIMVQGEAKIAVDQETVILHRGDAVVIDAREVHQMENAGSETVEYLAIGIATATGGKTVVVGQGQG
jgi:mannose-6-phosphate isomerase-like protein (cupin superfamily)